MDSIGSALKELERAEHIVRQQRQIADVEHVISETLHPPQKAAGRDWIRERENYQELILGNIEYDILIQKDHLDRNRLDELVDLMVDMVCSHREMAGDDYPAEVVKSRFLKLNSSHIEYVLYNAPATIDSYYASLVNHNLYANPERR